MQPDEPSYSNPIYAMAHDPKAAPPRPAETAQPPQPNESMAEVTEVNVDDITPEIQTGAAVISAEPQGGSSEA